MYIHTHLKLSIRNSVLSLIYRSGQKYVYSCEYVKQFVLVFLFVNYCITSHTNNYKPTLAPPCISYLQLIFLGFECWLVFTLLQLTTLTTKNQKKRIWYNSPFPQMLVLPWRSREPPQEILHPRLRGKVQVKVVVIWMMVSEYLLDRASTGCPIFVRLFMLPYFIFITFMSCRSYG